MRKPNERQAKGQRQIIQMRLMSTVLNHLGFYLKSDVLIQLTKCFCERFLPKYGDRTVDQMVQAARSVKQNIAEELTDGQTSFEVEIKLLGIARGSNQELKSKIASLQREIGILKRKQCPTVANSTLQNGNFSEKPQKNLK